MIATVGDPAEASDLRQLGGDIPVEQLEMNDSQPSPASPIASRAAPMPRSARARASPRRLIEELGPDRSGAFLNYRGETLPW